MADIKITPENRAQYGGDYRIRKALTMPDGTLSPSRPANWRSLIPTEPGAIINKQKPEIEVAIIPVEMSNFPAANTQRLQMLDVGYRFCIFDEWDLAPRYKEIWEKSADGKIVSNAGGNYALALMWCPKDLVEAREQEHMKWSDEIEQTFEEKLMQTQDEFNRATNQNISRRAYGEAIERHLERQERLTKRSS